MGIENKKVAIVGGGPGGLTLARILQQRGGNVTVYERDAGPDVRVQGGTLDLHEESGLSALREAGLMEAFRAAYRPGADRLTLTDPVARIVLEENVDVEAESSRPEIDRGPLRSLLLDSLQPGTVVWDRQFVSLTRQGQAIQLNFQNGSSVLADIVVAADGANSRIRPYITPIRPFYSGVTIIEGMVKDSGIATPGVHKLLKGGKIFAIGEGKTLIVSSKGDGGLAFYTGCKTNENWATDSGIDPFSRAQLLAWFKTEFSGWATVWDALFEQVTLPVAVRPQYCMPLDQTWEALPNLTMLGDAAHLMPPYAGEGVNMAMLDGLELGLCLTSPDFTESTLAIAAYERGMRTRASDAARITLEQTESLHSAQGLANLTAMFTTLAGPTA